MNSDKNRYAEHWKCQDCGAVNLVINDFHCWYCKKNKDTCRPAHGRKLQKDNIIQDIHAGRLAYDTDTVRA